MPFNVFQSPFEKLSTENQLLIVEELKAIREAIADEGGPFMTAILNISEQMTALVTINTKIHDAITGKSKEGGSGLSEAQMKALGLLAESFGKGLDLIVKAIEAYSKVDPKKFEELIEGIVKMGEAFKKSENAFKFFLELPRLLGHLALAIIGLGLALVISLPLYIVGIFAVPLIVLTIGSFLLMMGYVSRFSEQGTLEESLKALSHIALGIALFGLAVALMGPLYLVAAIFIIPIALVIGAFLLMFRVLADKDTAKNMSDGSKALRSMAWTLVLFGLAVALMGPIYLIGAIFIIPIILVIGALFLLMAFLDMMSETISDGAKALAWMALAIGLTGLALLLIGKIYEEIWAGVGASWPILLVIAALVAIMFFLDMMSDNIMEGVKALLLMVAAFAITALILWGIGKLSDEMQAGLGASWPILIVLAALVVIMLIMDTFKSNIMKGALAMIVMGGALIVIAGGLLIFKQANFTVADAAILSVFIIVLGLVATVLGAAMNVGLLPLLGAAAMAAIGVSIVILAEGLKIYTSAGFTIEDAAILSATIIALGLIGTVLGNPFTSWMTAIGAGLMVVIGAALVDITAGLKVFKESGIKAKDMDEFGKIIDAIRAPFEDFNLITATKVRRGIDSIKGIGNVMSSVALGIKELANLTFTTWAVEDDEDGNPVMVPVSVERLTPADLREVGVAFGDILGSILKPLSDNSELFDKNRKLRKGIKALTGIGNLMTSFATGIQDFANMTFVKYKVQDIDGKPELVPESVLEIDQNVLTTVGDNFSKIFDTIVTSVVKNAEKVDSKSTRKAIESLSGIGNIMTGFAEGIKGLSDMTYVKYKIVPNEQGTPELVPDTIVPIDDGLLVTAAGNFGQIFDSIIGLIVDNAEKVKGRRTRKAIESLTEPSNIVTGVAEAIKAFAGMSFTQMKVQEIDGVATLVPDNVITLDEAELKKATNNFDKVMNSIVNTLIYEGKKVDESEDSIEAMIEATGDITECVTSYAEVAKLWAEVKDPYRAAYALENFIKSAIGTFDQSGIYKKLSMMGIFTDKIETLGQNYRQLESTANSMTKIAKAMGVFKDNINSLDIELLSETRGLYEAMGVIAEAGSMEELLDKYGKSIEDTFEKLAELLEKFAEQMGENTPGGVLPNIPKPGEKPKSEEKPKDKSAEILSSKLGTMISSLQSIDSQLRSGIKTKNSTSIFGSP